MTKAMGPVTGVAAMVLLAGCATDSAAPSVTTATVTVSAAPAPIATPPAPVVTTTVVVETQAPVVEPVENADDAEDEMPGPCTDVDLAVSNKPLESIGTEYRLVLLFENTSSTRCRLNGYPGADIVNETGPAVHVERRQQIAAPVLVLQPGDVATADLQARDVHPQTDGPCPRWGSVTVIAPNTFQERNLDVGMPMCSALISSVT